MEIEARQPLPSRAALLPNGAPRGARRLRALAAALAVACSISPLLLWSGIAAALHSAPGR